MVNVYNVMLIALNAHLIAMAIHNAHNAVLVLLCKTNHVLLIKRNNMLHVHQDIQDALISLGDVEHSVKDIIATPKVVNFVTMLVENV